MEVYLKKLIVLGFLTASISGSMAAGSPDTETPEIESTEVWPESPGHGEEVYVDVETAGGVEDAWYVARSGEERVASRSLSDANDDGYYVSPVAFTAEGGQGYQVTVNICGSGDNCVKEEIELEAECSIGIGRRCLR